MAKRVKIKTKSKQEKPETIKGLKKLKIGTEVMYQDHGIFDKTQVIEINKKEGTALLSNRVLVSRGILDTGHLFKIGTVSDSVKIKIWDESCEQELELFNCKRYIHNLKNKLERNKDKIVKDPVNWLKFTRKVRKLEEKYLKDK